MKFAICLLTLGTLGWLGAPAAAQQNAIFNELTSQGVALPGGKRIVLPEPVMPDNLTAAQQQEILDKLAPSGRADEFAQGLKRSPFAMDRTDVELPAGQGVGRHYDLYFVAQGKLEKFADKDFIKKQLDRGGDRGDAEFLTVDQLKARNLEQADEPGFKERYVHADFELFGNVQVRGTAHGMQSGDGQGESMLVAFKLDPAFEGDKDFPNQWQPIVRKGGKALGAAQSYAGTGGYAKLTRLKGEPERIFVEYHIGFHEPHGWFDGGAMLATKVPSQFQEDVKKFRAEVRK